MLIAIMTINSSRVAVVFKEASPKVLNAVNVPSVGFPEMDLRRRSSAGVKSRRPRRRCSHARTGALHALSVGIHHVSVITGLSFAPRTRSSVADHVLLRRQHEGPP